jgi:hypothetical protein
LRGGGKRIVSSSLGNLVTDPVSKLGWDYSSVVAPGCKLQPLQKKSGRINVSAPNQECHAKVRESGQGYLPEMLQTPSIAEYLEDSPELSC